MPLTQRQKWAIKKRNRRGLTCERLKELFVYDQDAGTFRRTVDAGGYKAGAIAGGSTGKGYHYIGIDGAQWLTHQLAWLYVYGEWPSMQIDHINGNRADNRIANLREATDSQQRANSATHKNNTSGSRGVSFYAKHNRYKAKIAYNGTTHYLGWFKTREEAEDAYRRAATRLFGEFSAELR
jgi:hypothetical protein